MNLKNSFISWIINYKDEEGNAFSDKTIDGFVHSLESYPSSIQDLTFINYDLFGIYKYEDLLLLKQKLQTNTSYASNLKTNDPDSLVFEEALDIYEEFLIEYEFQNDSLSSAENDTFSTTVPSISSVDDPQRYIVLTQNKASVYDDMPYKEYHYPYIYSSQIHVNDKFIYYGVMQAGGEKVYYGCGTIASIRQIDADNYIAELKDCYQFQNTVSRKGDSSNYLELEGRSSNVPFVRAIRLLTPEAYAHIIRLAGELTPALPSEVRTPGISGSKPRRNPSLHTSNASNTDVSNTDIINNVPIRFTSLTI